MSTGRSAEKSNAPPVLPVGGVRTVPTSELDADDAAALLDDEREVPGATRAFDDEVGDGDAPR